MLGKEGNICVPRNISGTMCPHCQSIGLADMQSHMHVLSWYQ